jgi:hypothetical protein
MNELQLAHFLISLSITSDLHCLTFVTHTYLKKLVVLRAFPTLKGLRYSAPILLTSHQQIKEDLVRQYGAHVVDTTGYTLTIPYEQLYPVVVSPRAYITVTLVTPDVT